MSVSRDADVHGPERWENDLRAAGWIEVRLNVWQRGDSMNETTRPTDGPWIWSYFCKPDGEPIRTVQDVADTVAGSVHHSERAELFGVTLDDAGDNPDGRATVVCYTGNGPNAHNNARLIAVTPIMVDFLRRLMTRDQGFVYSRDERDARAILQFIDGHAEAPQSAAAVDPHAGSTGKPPTREKKHASVPPPATEGDE